MKTFQFKSHGITVSIDEISPAKAAQMLDTINIGNRKITKTRVDQYKRDLLNGDWLFNGDAIRIDEHGVLIDGQHRLTAVAQSGVFCEFLIIRGIKSKHKHTIDTGKGRTGGDTLSIQSGVSASDSHVISGAISTFVKYKKSGFGSYGGGNRLTNTEILNCYHENKHLIDSSLEMMKQIVPMRGLLMQKVDILFLFMIFSEIDSSDARAYLSKILTGAEIATGSTEMHIRNIIIDCKTGVRKTNKKILINSIIKCWNTVRRGGQIKHKQNCAWRPASEKAPIAS